MANYIRKDHLIVNQDIDEQTHHKSINAAKKASRKLQLVKDNTMCKASSRNTRLHVKVYSKCQLK